MADSRNKRLSAAAIDPAPPHGGDDRGMDEVVRGQNGRPGKTGGGIPIKPGGPTGLSKEPLIRKKKALATGGTAQSGAGAAAAGEWSGPAAFRPDVGLPESFSPGSSLAEPYRARDVIPNYDPQTDAAYRDAMQALRDAEARLPGYTPGYDDELEGLFREISGRGPFRYDLDADTLYRQYRQQYTDLGRRAMQDTMGRAASLTGGYGSSYAQNAGQQAYNGYLQQLNDRIPELEERAYQRWLADGDALRRRYDMTRDMARDEYSRYRDAVSDWRQDLTYADDQAQQAYRRGVERWQRENALNEEQEDRDYRGWKSASEIADAAYQRERDAWDRETRRNETAWKRAKEQWEADAKWNEAWERGSGKR